MNKKNILKTTLKFIIFILVFYFTLIYELPFYIKRGGGVIDISKRVNIDESYPITGSYNMAYVSELKATIPIYLIAKINKNWDIEKKEEEIINENKKDSDIRGEIALNEANQTATIIAYQKAHRDVKINKTKIIVTYIDQYAKTNLKVGDEILKINNDIITSIEDINKIISNLNIGDTLNIKVKNNDEYERTAKIIEYKNKKIIGIIIYQNYDLDISPNIKFKFEHNESGSSGGLMMTLAIYDYLTQLDLAKGRKIAGTGTIDINGEIGQIDGIKYKIQGAIKDRADIFLVPDGDNYKEALKVIKENNYKIKLIPVKTIDDAIEYLKK